MKRGFSLLEVLLAVGLLGGTLPILLTYMAESASGTGEKSYEVLILNTQKSVEAYFSVVRKELRLDADKRAYCGYKGGQFTIDRVSTGFDGEVFALKREEKNGLLAEKSLADGSGVAKEYQICVWDNEGKKAKCSSLKAVALQAVISTSLGSKEWEDDQKSEQVLGAMVGMEEIYGGTAWAYSKATVDAYGHGAIYGAAQVFEYTININRKYRASIFGDDKIAQQYGKELYNSLDATDHNRRTNWTTLAKDKTIGEIAKQTLYAHLAVANALKNSGGGGGQVVLPLHKVKFKMQSMPLIILLIAKKSI